jgi:Ca2+-binding EF-hand superfamily protein
VGQLPNYFSGENLAMRRYACLVVAVVSIGIGLVASGRVLAQEPKRDRQGPAGKSGADPTAARPTGEQLFQRLDRDGDGKLMGDEIPDRVWDQMEAVDTDQDGSITVEELKKALAKASDAGREAGAAAAVVVTQILQRLDKNGDSKLTKDELTGPWAQRLLQADGNRDGVLSKEELAAAAAKLQGLAGDAAPRSAAVVLQTLDKNRDGKLTKDELPERVAEHFSAADKNGDGSLSTAELEEVLKQTTPRQGQSGAAGRQDAQQMFQRADKNGDGKLSKDELPPQMADRLMRADTDGDGQLSREELAAVRQRLESRPDGNQ